MVIVKEESYEPIHTEVWRKLEELEEQLYKKDKMIHQLKRANSKQKNTIRRIRKERDELLKRAGENRKQHYRNGQKRGRTRNG